MLKITHLAVAFYLVGTCLSTSVRAAVVTGDTVTASNTFQNPTFTGNAETIFAVDAATITETGIELVKFAGIYDADFSGTGLTMTLADNSGLSFLTYDAGTFDRYYFGFTGHTVDSVSIVSGDNALTNGLNFGLLTPGFELNVADLFGTGISLPREYPNGGFFLEFGEGTDLSTVGSSLSLGFTTTAIPEPSSAALLGSFSLSVLLRRRRSNG